MKPVYIDFNNNSKISLYAQLYDYLKREISQGNIKAGERLPSLRALSNQIGDSITTCSRAYDQLLLEGYIDVKPQSGYYVNDIDVDTGTVSAGTVTEKTAELLLTKIVAGIILAFLVEEIAAMFPSAPRIQCIRIFLTRRNCMHSILLSRAFLPGNLARLACHPGLSHHVIRSSGLQLPFHRPVHLPGHVIESLKHSALQNCLRSLAGRVSF